VLRERGVTEALVVGHSMGSQVVVELARRAPALVEGAVLIGPVVDPERPGAVLQGLALLRDCLREPVGVDALLLADYLRSLRWYLRQLPEMLHHPVQERLAEVTRPVLIVRGRRDPIATRDWCERLLARAQDGRLVEAAASRHVVPRTEPGWLAEQLVRFADAVGVAPAPAPASAAAAAAAEEAAA
jgi:pimeloyl-ACP methyl ester carboxylesterase